MELVTEKLRLTPEEVLGQCAPAWLGLESRLAIKIARWEDKCDSVQLEEQTALQPGYLQLLHSVGVLQQGVELCLRR